MRSLVPSKANGVIDSGASLRTLPWEPDRLFDRLIGDFWGHPSSRLPGGAPLEIVEQDDVLRVAVEVPGIDPNELEISLTGQVLTLAAEKRDDLDEASGRRTYTERQFGSFRRSIELPCPVDADKVTAEHRFGVVTITLHKSDAVRPRKIAVKMA